MCICTGWYMNENEDESKVTIWTKKTVLPVLLILFGLHLQLKLQKLCETIATVYCLYGQNTVNWKGQQSLPYITSMAFTHLSLIDQYYSTLYIFAY